MRRGTLLAFQRAALWLPRQQSLLGQQRGPGWVLTLLLLLVLPSRGLPCGPTPSLSCRRGLGLVKELEMEPPWSRPLLLPLRTG